MGVDIRETGKSASEPAQPSNKADRIEARSHKIAFLFSIFALALMLWGLASALAEGRFSLPGASVTPLTALVTAPFSMDFLRCMSIGILLLGALPVLKVVMSAWKFMGSRETANAAVALVVLMELAFSILIR